MNGALTIFRPRRFAALFRADVQNVSRDPIMVMALLPLFILPVLVRFFGPALDEYGAQAFGFTGFSFYITVFTLPLTTVLLGWVTGMLLLEDRDDGPLLALEVTPVGKAGFFLYRALVTAVMTFLVSLAFCAILLPERGGLHLLLSVLLALEAVIIAFVLLAWSRNRVEGLALSKVLNLAALVPFLALIPGAAGWLGGVIPTFWIGKFLFVDEITPLMLAAAIAVHLGILAWSYHTAKRRLG